MKIGENNYLLLPTLKLNLLRSFCTGVVFSILFITNITGQNAPMSTILLTPFFMPVMTLLFWVVYWVTSLFGLGGVGSLMLMFTTVPGDPLVYLLFKIKPEWKPVDTFHVINFAGLIFVYEIPKDEFEKVEILK